MDPDYAATDRRVDITFTGAAAFSVTITDVSSRAQTALGSGTMGTAFAASDGSFVIPVANWSGTGAAADVISFLTDSHISVNDGLRFIQHAERMIDARIGAIGGAYKTLDSTIDRLFTVSTLPSVIGQATTYLAAYLIWAIIHSGVMTQTEDKGLPSAVNLWRKLAEDWVSQWMVRETERTSQSLPTWVARQSLFNYVGLEDIGLGMLAETEQGDITMPEDRDDWGWDDSEYGGGSNDGV